MKHEILVCSRYRGEKGESFALARYPRDQSITASRKEKKKWKNFQLQTHLLHDGSGKCSRLLKYKLLTCINTIPKWLFDKEDFSDTPSVRDGIATSQEQHDRAKGCSFIIAVGAKLSL
jgi:hypothetical protein